MKILRTPEERFANLAGYDFDPHYVEVEGLRIHYVDEGPRQAEAVVMFHGEPSWAYLYRKMIPIFVDAGYRAIAPDMVGFGRSDKLASRDDYSYQKQVDWMAGWLQALDLRDATLICQDWGSLIGLRLVAQDPDRFARVVLANGGLPTGDQSMPEAFYTWQAFSQRAGRLPIGRIIKMGSQTRLSKDVIAGYEAPFPDESYKEAARIFPALVPTTPDDPAAEANRQAWQVLRNFRKPFLTAFSDGDPITRGADRLFQLLVRGARGQPHTTITGAGHFLQEDKGQELAQVVVDWMVHNPSPQG
jgi:haloalkane dehalogenase